MAKGFFITFEGGEGCGKTTQIKALLKHLQAKGFECVLTREPGGAPLSEKIRELLLHAKEGNTMSPRAELLLFEAARNQHVIETIQPALQEGKIVISDRFYDSTTAYQGAARKLDQNDVRWLNDFATEALKPDLTIVLDVPVEVGLSRARIRDDNKTDRMGSLNIDFYQKVREAFLNLAKESPERVVVVPVEECKEDTFEKIAKLVDSKLK